MSEYVLATVDPAPCVWSFYPTREAAEAAAPAVVAKEGKPYVPMTMDEYSAAHDRHYLAAPLMEIDRAKWWEMLEVLPPARWETRDGVERFCLAEMLSGPITSQFARWGGRYFTRNVNICDRATWITGAECEAFAAANPSGPGFDHTLVRIARKRFSVTQGEVEVFYGDRRLEQYGDDIAMRDAPEPGAVAIGGWSGRGDAFWWNVARRVVTGEG